MEGEEVITLGTETPEPQESEQFGDFITPTEEPEQETPETEEQPQETPPEEPAEAKKDVLPAEVAKFLREVKESSPESAPIVKQLNNVVFSHKAYKEIFPDIEDARTLKATFEAVGGREGILDLQSTAETLADIDKMLETGDAKLVHDILAKSPDGFKKIVPAAVEAFQKLDPQAYESFLRPELAKAVVGSTIGMYLEAALESLKSGDTDMALRRLSPALGWVKGLEQELQEHQKTVTAQGIKPDTGRLDDLNKREYEMNSKWVQRDMNSYALSQVDASLRPLLKGVNLSKEAVSDLQKGIMAEIGNSLMEDKTFQRQMDNLVQKGENDKALSLAKVHIDKVRQQAVKDVYARRYSSLRPSGQSGNGNRTGAKPAPKVGTPGVLQTAKRPPLEAIDMRKTTQDMIFAHRAILKDGRTVTWPR